MLVDKVKRDNCNFFSNFHTLDSKKIVNSLDSIKNLIVANEVFLIISNLKVKELIQKSKKTRGLFILTNKKIIFVNRVLFGKKVYIIKLEDISEVSLIEKKGKAILKILTDSSAYKFGNFKKKYKDQIINKITNLVKDLKKPSTF